MPGVNPFDWTILYRLFKANIGINNCPLNIEHAQPILLEYHIEGPEDFEQSVLINAYHMVPVRQRTINIIVFNVVFVLLLHFMMLYFYVIRIPQIYKK